MRYNNTLHIVTSLGRSGSSILDASIRNSNLKEDKRNHFWKTHYDAKEVLNTSITFKKNIKNIFIYRDPIEILLSLLNLYRDNRKEYGLEGKKFIYSHCQNMRRDWDVPIPEVVNNFDTFIIERDILRLERMYDSFVQNHRYDTLMINYNQLWENKNKIEEYLNTKLILPVKRKRDKKEEYKQYVSEKEYKNLLTTYKSLSQKIKEKPPYWLIEKKTLAEKRISELEKGTDTIIHDVINLNTPTQWKK